LEMVTTDELSKEVNDRLKEEESSRNLEKARKIVSQCGEILGMQDLQSPIKGAVNKILAEYEIKAFFLENPLSHPDIDTPRSMRDID